MANESPKRKRPKEAVGVRLDVEEVARVKRLLPEGVTLSSYVAYLVHVGLERVEKAR